MIKEWLASAFFKRLFGAILKAALVISAYTRGRNAGEAGARTRRLEADLKGAETRKQVDDATARRTDDENRERLSRWSKKPQRSP